MIEQWIKWEPFFELASNYYLESVSDSIDKFVVVLSEENDKNKQIRIDFGDTVDAYRTTYESFRLKIIHELDQKYGADFYTKWSFFKVLNSSYLKWLSEESYGTTDALFLTHYVVFTVDFVIDILAYQDPKVEIYIE